MLAHGERERASGGEGAVRKNKEWIGATDDAKIPDRVKLRIWSREDGRCYLTGRQIRPGDKYEFEHVVALCNGGEHRESNIALALKEPHKAKTARDRSLKAKGDRVTKRHAGIRSSYRPLPCGRNSPWRKKINGTVERRDG